jgi:hypothetical protein
MTDETRIITAVTSTWNVDSNGYLLTTSGAKVARVAGQVIMLYDKRERVEVPFTQADWVACQMQTQQGDG